MSCRHASAGGAGFPRAKAGCASDAWRQQDRLEFRSAIAIVVATALIGIAVAVLIEDKAASVAMEIGLNGSAMFLGKIIRDTRRRRRTLT